MQIKLPCKSEVLLHTAFSGVEPPKVSGRTDFAAFTPLWGCHAMPLAWHFSFCNNEVDWEPIDGGQQFDYDIDAVGAALRLATYNYMNGLGLDQPVRSWFPIRVPRPTQERKH